MRTRLESRRTFSAGSVLGERKRSTAGYTFAEVLVAAAILGVVATSLYAAFSGGFFIIQSTRENLRATQVMVQKLEAIRLLTWSQLGNTNYLKPVFTEPYDPLGATNNSTGAKYTGYVTTDGPVADLPDAYRDNMRTVTVSLYWTNFLGSRAVVHQREMQTRVARNGMQNYIWGAL